MSAGWTPERVALLRKLHEAGLTASQIAAALGDGVTRGAVIGKASRLGLASNIRALQLAEQRRQRARDAVREAAAAREAEAEAAAAAAAAAHDAEARRASPAIALPISKRVTILDLRDSMCRWPIGDPVVDPATFRFCGARRAETVLAYRGARKPTPTSYCAAHHQLAHQPRDSARRFTPRAAA